MSNTEQSGCIYTQLDNGIHEFVFTGHNENGTDEMFAVLEHLLEITPTDATLRYLIDTTRTDKDGSLASMVQRFRRLEVKFPERARGRTAILHQGDIMLTLANTLIGTLAPDKDKTRFFKVERRQKAIDWLLAE